MGHSTNTMFLAVPILPEETNNYFRGVQQRLRWLAAAQPERAGGVLEEIGLGKSAKRKMATEVADRFPPGNSEPA
jgi:hypothetical protein